MRKKIYRAAVIAAVIGCVVMALMCWYAVGVIEKSNMTDALESRVIQLTERVDAQQSDYDAVFENMDTVCKEKAKTLALLISKYPEMLDDETWLEEMRLMTDADAICITNEKGECQYSAGSSDELPDIHDEFKAALNSKSFSDYKLYRVGNDTKAAAASSRLDKSGIVQLEFTPDKTGIVSAMAENSNILTDVTFMKTGCLGVIDRETGKYLYHTNNDMVGEDSLFNIEKEFPEEEGDTIDSHAGGQDVLLSYRNSNAGIVIGYVSYGEVYETRDDTTVWVVLAAVIVALVLTLAVRNRVLNMTRKKR